MQGRKEMLPPLGNMVVKQGREKWSRSTVEIGAAITVDFSILKKNEVLNQRVAAPTSASPFAGQICRRNRRTMTNLHQTLQVWDSLYAPPRSDFLLALAGGGIDGVLRPPSLPLLAAPCSPEHAVRVREPTWLKTLGQQAQLLVQRPTGWRRGRKHLTVRFS